MDSVALTDALRETLALFDSPEPRTTTEIADALGLGRRSTYDRLDRLVDRDRLETKTVGANGRVWWRPAGATADEPRSTADIERRPSDSTAAGAASGSGRDSGPLAEPYDVLFDHASPFIWLLDPDGTVVDVNDTARSFGGVDRATVVGDPLWETAWWRDADEPGERLRAAIRRATEGESVRYEAAVSDGDDTVVIDLAVRPVTDADDTALVAEGWDVTTRNQRERTLTEYRQWHETLVENYPSGAVAIVDTDLRYVTFGGTVEGETDLARSDIEGACARTVLPDKLADVVVPGYERALDGTSSTFEAAVDDRAYEFHFHPVRDESGTVFAATAISQEITDRKRRERELRTRIRQQEVVAELGERALEDPALETVMADATTLVADTLDTDYCKVLDLGPDGDELLLREGVGWADGLVGTATVSAHEADSQAAYTLATEGPVIVSDLTTEPRFSGPALLTDHSVHSGISTIIGSPTEPWGVLGVHDTAHREFSDHDAAFVQSVANILATAVERHQYEQTLLEQRSHLAALNDLNDAVWGLTGAMFDQSTRRDIEATVCDWLAGVPSYDGTWIAAVDRQAETFDLRVAAGFDADLDAVSLTATDDGSVSQQLMARAARTGDMQVSSAPADGLDLPLSVAGSGDATRTVAVIPIVHEGTTYGLLGLVSERAAGVDGPERGVVEQLGAVVGHAIAAVERERVLMSDEITEIEFGVTDYLERVGVAGPTDGTIRIDRLTPIGEETFLGYGVADAEAGETLEAMGQAHAEIDEVRLLDRDGDTVRFELRTSAPLQSVISAHGGYVHEVRIDDGELGMIIHLPPDATLRRIIDAVKQLYPSADLVTRRQVTRETPAARTSNELTDALTERQRTVLEVAVSAGYFAWPRDVSGETIADSLDIAPSTFHYHLRKAERAIFEAVVATQVQPASRS